jgi:hypothetical protein
MTYCPAEQVVRESKVDGGELTNLERFATTIPRLNLSNNLSHPQAAEASQQTAD